MVWRPFVPTTDRSMILATRGRSEGLDEKRPITEALQLRILTVSDSLGHHDSAWGSWDGGSFDRDDAGVMGVIAA
jgi:hypothetical protein